MSKTKGFLFSVAVAVAMVFTISCSSDDGGGSSGNNKGNGESNECDKASSLPFVALFAGVSAQDVNGMVLDVIIHDFPVGYEGFEEFDAELGDNGKCTNQYGGRMSNWKPENAICFTGDRYHPCSEGGTMLRYGQLNASTGAIKGYCNGPDKEPLFGNENCNNPDNNGNWGEGNRGWSNPVGVTKGMVEEWLNYDACRHEDLVGEASDPMYIRGRYCARPMPANGQCYGANLHQWFTNCCSAKTIVDIMTLNRLDNRNLFQIKYDYSTRNNWNGFGEDMGYFPLDKYNDNDTYGKRSLNVWCPNNLDENDANKTECDRWRSNGGPKNGDAARKTAEGGGVDKRKWHNYGFTMAGSGEFKYEQGAGDEFKFIGDDDMWIFLDGKLAVDLGGVHLAAPGKVKIDEWAQQNGWENGTMHVINFFYAERQTEGSNMMLQVALTDLKPPRFGAPRILKAETVVDENGKGTTTILVNSEFDLDQIRKFINEWNEFPIVVHREGNPDNGKKDVNGYKLESIEYVASSSDGFYYRIVGAVCVDGRSCKNSEPLNTGNYISFNVFATDLDGMGFGNPGVGFPQNEDFYIRNKRGVLAATPSWALNTSKLPDIDPCRVR